MGPACFVLTMGLHTCYSFCCGSFWAPTSNQGSPSCPSDLSFYGMTCKKFFFHLCCGLDVDCPPKALLLKICPCGNAIGGGTLESLGLVWGFQVIGGVPWRGWWNPDPFLPGLAPWLVIWVVLVCPVLLPWCTALPEAQSCMANQLWTGTSKTVSQNKSFLLIIISGILL
jgi:hypothetical protein